MTEPVRWTLVPGTELTRVSLHAQYGGSNQGGISPSVRNRLVMIFTDPGTGTQYGYHDDWHEDGCFHYTGTGQRGDQRLDGFNGSILEHKKKHRSLQLFEGSAGTVRYVGEFQVDDGEPSYSLDALDVDGQPRKVVVFRLRPLNVAPPARSTPSPLKPDTVVTNVEIEAQNSELHEVKPNGEPYEAQRRESGLVQRFKRELERRGIDVTRNEIVPAGEARSLYTDLFIASKNVLIEAKGTVERGAIRTAIGQLADYRRFLDAPRCAVLVPSKPTADLLALLDIERIAAVWESELGFEGLDMLLS